VVRSEIPRRRITALAVVFAAHGCARIGDGEPGDEGGPPGATPDAGPSAADAGGDDATAGGHDAAPCVDGSFQLLANPGFDEGAVGWTEVGGPINYPDEQIPVEVQAGTRAALLGRPVAAEQRLAQIVSIPADTVSLTWSGYTCFVTARVDASTDAVRLDLLTPGGGTLQALAMFGDEDAGGGCNWAARTLPLASPHAGEEVELAFSAHSDNSGLTSFYFDTLALQAVVDCP
jgi:hypothetical protein